MTITLDPTILAALQSGTIHLDQGAHGSWEDGHCAMETVARLAGEGHTDAPACASPVLARYITRLNDCWDDTQRQTLAPYLPRTVGTASDGQDAARVEIARQALVTDLLPAWLRLAGLTAEADGLAAVPPAELRQHMWVLCGRLRDLRTVRYRTLEARVREQLQVTHHAAAVAAAAAAAVAAADADAAAVAVAVAVADAAAARRAARKAFAEAIATSPQGVGIRQLATSQNATALALLDRLIDPSANA